MRTSIVEAQLETLPKREHLRILVCGEHDLGRVDFAMSFPNAVIVDASGTLCEREDRADVPILRTANVDAIEDLARKIAGGFIGAETFVIDGFPFVEECLDARLRDIKGYEHYAAKSERYAALMAVLRSLPCHLVVVTRVRQELARPGSIFGGRLVTDMDRIVLGTAPDIHKPLLEHFDVVLETVRASSGRAMVAVKTSVLREIEADEIVVPDGTALIGRLSAATPRPSSAPTPQLYATYLRLKTAIAAAGVDDDALGAIRRLCVVPASERTSPFLAGDEVEALSARFAAFLVGDDPIALGAEDQATAASASQPSPAESPATTPLETHAADVEEPARPSPTQPEWVRVKERLTELNVLLDRTGRAHERIDGVMTFLRTQQLYAQMTPSGQILCTKSDADEALRKLDVRIAELTPLELPIAS